MNTTSSPWRFLTALDGEAESDRKLVSLTRQEELQSITDMVAASRSSILYAASGNGKSSIINAGLIPFFRQRGYAVYRTRPRPPSCTSDPCLAFKKSVMEEFRRPLFSGEELDALSRAVEQAGPDPSAENRDGQNKKALLQDKIRALTTIAPSGTALLAPHLKRPLQEFVHELQNLHPHGTQILFICDQFEELFVHFTNQPELGRFADELGAVWADSKLNVRLLFSMREDWVGSMIEFRRTIPAIFGSCFKLEPLRRSHAHHVLEEPLKHVDGKYAFSPDATEALLDDLVKSYAEVRARRLWGAFESSTPGPDAYIELPALQILADELWATREKLPSPFSLEHYRALARWIDTGARLDTGDAEAKPDVEANQSVAEVVLGCYLDQHLFDEEEQDLRKRQFEGELRLDCLYLLTDGTRHRRAMPESTLLEQVNRLRLTDGEAERMSLEMMRSCLARMQKARIVLESAASQPGDALQLELAHDFAVRATVLRWRQLERKRLASLAVKAQQQKLKEEALAALRQRQHVVGRYWSFLPTIALAGLCVFTGGAYWSASDLSPNDFYMSVLFFASAFAGISAGMGTVLLGTLQPRVSLRLKSWSLAIGLVCPEVIFRILDAGSTPTSDAATDMLWTSLISCSFLSLMFRGQDYAEVSTLGFESEYSVVRSTRKFVAIFGCWIATATALILLLGLPNRKISINSASSTNSPPNNLQNSPPANSK